MTTYSPKAGEVQRKWYVIDAEDIVLGRLATTAANLLRGKHKPQYAPHIDTGDFVVVVNASKIALTGKKATDSLRYDHSGRPGGLRVTSMMPKNKLSRQQLKKLKVYGGPEHPHAAQNPQPYEITQIAQ